MRRKTISVTLRGMAKVYAGTSGWSYASWKPDFYPARLASSKFLSYYATRLNSAKCIAEYIKAMKGDNHRQEVFVYFKHEETPEGALRAEALLAAINAGSASKDVITDAP